MGGPAAPVRFGSCRRVFPPSKPEKGYQNTPNTTKKSVRRSSTGRSPYSRPALLAVVAVLAAWSGYAAAKFSTDSSLLLAKAQRPRPGRCGQPRRAQQPQPRPDHVHDWFRLTSPGTSPPRPLPKALQPQLRPCFRAWQATDPETNPRSPPGPTYMPDYHQPQKSWRPSSMPKPRPTQRRANGGSNSDSYVRTTVYLATVFSSPVSAAILCTGPPLRSGHCSLVILLVAMASLAPAPKPI